MSELEIDNIKEGTGPTPEKGQTVRFIILDGSLMEKNLIVVFIVEHGLSLQ